VQQKCNPLFQKAWEKKGSKCGLWESMRHLFASFGRNRHFSIV
jgi:hypothetical protein